jgi:hypothetical protein
LAEVILWHQAALVDRHVRRSDTHHEIRVLLFSGEDQRLRSLPSPRSVLSLLEEIRDDETRAKRTDKTKGEYDAPGL